MPLEAFEEPDRGDEPTGPGQEPAYREPVSTLLIEHRRVERALWAELERHQREHGCEDVRPHCDLQATLLRAWIATVQMAEALDFVVLGETPFSYRRLGAPDDWAPEFLPGPWPPYVYELREARP
jgi:hypothetical protein